MILYDYILFYAQKMMIIMIHILVIISIITCFIVMLIIMIVFTLLSVLLQVRLAIYIDRTSSILKRFVRLETPSPKLTSDRTFSIIPNEGIPNNKPLFRTVF